MFIRQNDRTLDSPEAMDALLAPLGIVRDHWDITGLDPALCRAASKNPDFAGQVLATVREPLEALKAQHGYLTEDIVSLSPETPGLDDILAKFDKEHHHTDDEVRAVLYGNGIFGVVPPEGQPFEIHVGVGDLIVVPAYTRHWFTLKEDREIVALRVFKTPEGWTAIYQPEATPSAAGASS